MLVIGISGGDPVKKHSRHMALCSLPSTTHSSRNLSSPLLQHIFFHLLEHFRLIYKIRHKHQRPRTRPPDQRAPETWKKKDSHKLVSLKPTASENPDASESNSLHCQEEWRLYNELLACSSNSLKLAPPGPQRKSYGQLKLILHVKGTQLILACRSGERTLQII